MKAKLISILVDDQEKALKFYTDTLGFEKKTEVPMGEYKWLTVISKEDMDGPEILLEPMAFEPAQVFQKALFAAGIPLNSFSVDDVQEEYSRLTAAGVAFKMPPTPMGPVIVAMLDDTCGNYIQLVQTL